MAIAASVEMLYELLSENCIPCTSERADKLLADVLLEGFSNRHPAAAEDFANHMASMFQFVTSPKTKFPATQMTISRLLTLFNKRAETPPKKVEGSLPVEDDPPAEGGGRIVTP